MFRTVKINRPITLEELKELVRIMEYQDSTDREVSTIIHFDGNFAKLDIEFDEDGDATVL